MAFHGMDLERSSDLARLIDTYVEVVEKTGAAMARRINELPWWGADAENFKSNQLSELLSLGKATPRRSQSTVATVSVQPC